jgi:1,4-alpha-glucan branching enzyme
MQAVTTIAAVLAALSFAAFSPIPSESREEKTKTEYSLRFISKAQPPSQMTLLCTEEGSPKVKRGILFTYSARGAKKVSIAGDFSCWKAEQMTKGKNGVWFYFLAEPAKESTRYKFIADGIWISDPVNMEQEDDGNGSFLSIARGKGTEESRHVSYRIISADTVEFRRWDDNARFVSIVGDFNNWNPENDILTRSENNIWRIKKRMPKGTYRYTYIVDGKWLPDFYNASSSSDAAGNVCSVIKIQ